MSKETIGIAADPGGFLKRAIAEEIEAADIRSWILERHEKSVDYPDYAEKLVRAISDGIVKKGVLVCGTGIGISIAANRHMGIRAALCYDKGCGTCPSAQRCEHSVLGGKDRRISGPTTCRAFSRY